MIEINLLPEELRAAGVKEKKPDSGPSLGQGLELKHLVLLIPLIFGILFCVHLIIGISGLMKSGKLHILRAKWQALEPQRKVLDEFNSEYSLLSDDVAAMEQLIGKRIIWSEKLNKLSLDLPSGVWFNEFSVNGKELILHGSVVSLNKEELGLIRQLIDNLKNDAVFFKDFNSIEMEQAEKRNVGGYDITDFTLKAGIKIK